MKRINLEEINNRIKIRFPEEKFEIISYSSLGKPGKIKCCNCGQIIEISKFSNFFAKNKVYGCVNCHGLWKKRKEKIKEIQKHYNILNSCVKGTHTYYTIQCKRCGHIRQSTLNNLYKHLERGCQEGKCLRNRSPQEFINEVNQKNFQNFQLMSEYKNQSTKVLVKHVDCGFIFQAWPHDLVDDKKHCPKCSKRKGSLGEQKIEKILKQLNIDYVRECYLENSRQRFDFYIEKQQKKYAIEFNGKQHYEEINFYHDTLQERKMMDQKKIQYCIKHNIKLIIIPYYYSDNKIKQTILDKLND